MELTLNHDAPSIRELTKALKSEFSNQFSYSTLGFSDRVYISYFIIPMGKIVVKPNEVSYKRPKGLMAILSGITRILTGYADRMEPHLQKLENCLEKFLIQLYV